MHRAFGCLCLGGLTVVAPLGAGATPIAEVRSLTREKADHGVAVEVRGMITWRAANAVNLDDRAGFHHLRATPGTAPLPSDEKASVPATAAGRVRYLFAIPQFKNANNPYPENQIANADETLMLSGATRPRSVTLLASGAPLEFRFEGNVLTVFLPAAARTPAVDVVRVEL